jgi:predicted RNA-binding Zn-ribbon protein involved in translation (DUF1610 family)
MSDRKYRQHGYQDSGEKSRPQSAQKPKAQDNTFGPRPLNMPGARTVSRCAVCGVVIKSIDETGKCPNCGLDLHSCKMCTHFDPASRFECRQTISERVIPKDTQNNCTAYLMKQSVERETGSSPSSGRVNDARQAFENLFKK